MGIFIIPIFPVIRQALSVMVDPQVLPTALALDAVATEFTFIVGPIVATQLVLGTGSGPALIVIGVASAAAGLGLFILNPPTRSTQARPHEADSAGDGGAPSVGSTPGDGEAAAPGERSPSAGSTPGDGEAAAPGERSPSAGSTPGDGEAARVGDASPSAGSTRLLTPAVLAILACSTATTFTLAGVDLSVVASLREWSQASLTGLILALWAGGSLVGGLIYGALPRHAPVPPLVGALAITTAMCALAWDPLTLLIAVFISGLFCAPAMTSVNHGLVTLVPEHRRGEVMGWNGTMLQLGGACAAPIAGRAIDAFDARAGYLSSAIAGAKEQFFRVVSESVCRGLRGGHHQAAGAGEAAPNVQDARGGERGAGIGNG
jgi:predicted MFS family arabinose efflux permease